MPSSALVPSKEKTNPQPDTSNHYLPTLDGWRAIAIAMVVLSHGLTTGSGRGGGGSLNLLTFRLGTFGVMLFFAISGYLICTRLLIEEETTGSVSLRSFYIRRVFRILPAAYGYLGTVAVLALAGILVIGWADIAGAALFYSNYIESQSWFTGHFWSLALEEHFYLLWPPVLVLLGRKRAVWAGALLIALTLFLRYLTLGRTPDGADLQGYTHLRLDAFMFPCILAILLRDMNLAKRFAAAMTPRAWYSLIAGLGVGIALGVFVPAWRESQRVFQAAALPVIIVTTVLRPNDWIGRQLRRPALEWLGRISYSVYLWQQLVFGQQFISGYSPATWSARLVLLSFQIVLILTVAVLSRRWIEEPLIAFGRQMASQSRLADSAVR
jgi:peptidoglycan/LPS O-acetylase OafA/YrhL